MAANGYKQPFEPTEPLTLSLSKHINPTSEPP